jgi:membrane protease YdiL (CAAX protease family)
MSPSPLEPIDPPGGAGAVGPAAPSSPFPESRAPGTGDGAHTYARPRLPDEAGSPGHAPPDGAGSEDPDWSAWQGLLGFIAALLVTVLLGAVVVSVLSLVLQTPVRENSPALNIAGVVVQDFALIAVAIAFAAISARPRAWQFGLRRTRLWSTIGWAVLGLFLYFVFNVAYEALVDPRAEQSVADALGVNESGALLVLGGFVIIVMAPIAEEFFFRAFFYRSLRNSLARRLGRGAGVALGALLTGLIFGLVHFESDALAIIPVLTALGVMFCLVYERTGSLFAVIALHAFINSLAYLTVAKNSAPVALGFGGGMILACAVFPRLLSRGPAPAAA